MKVYLLKLADHPGNLNPEIEVTYTDNNRIKCSFSSKQILTGKYRCFPFKATKELRDINGDQNGYKIYFEKLGYEVKEIKTYEY